MDEWINKKDIIRELCLTTGCSYHDVVIGTIMEFPADDVQPVVHGRWIEHCDDLFPLESTIECSVCGERENMDMCNDNFCPNCGARMDSNKRIIL